VLQVALPLQSAVERQPHLSAELHLLLSHCEAAEHVAPTGLRSMVPVPVQRPLLQVPEQQFELLEQEKPLEVQ